MTHIVLSIGGVISWDGDVWTVAEIAGEHAVLLRPDGSKRGVLFSILAREARPVGDTPIDPVASASNALLETLPESQRRTARERLEHVNEVMCGYRSGSPESAKPGEPSPTYDPEQTEFAARVRAKAADIGMDASSIYRWIDRFDKYGVRGLVDGRKARGRTSTGRTDPRWIAVATEVVGEWTDESTPTATHLLRLINERVTQRYGAGAVPIPSDTVARERLAAITRGTHALKGSAKRKRDVAARPKGAYGALRATRPGQYVMLDATRLDVFAMCPRTLRWMSLELAVAMDLYSRTVVGLRLAPSIKYIDAALMLYEAITPDSRNRTDSGILPYAGMPEATLIGPGLAEANDSGLPGIAPETLIVDHGRNFFNVDTVAMANRLQFDIQPARKATGRDKAAVERLFRTIRESLLVAIRGYKGPDIYSRGLDAEKKAFYFSFELEEIIRQWVCRTYHHTPHADCIDESVPGLKMTPLQMLAHGRARAGSMTIPLTDTLVFDFLPTAWRKIQHYGVDLHGARYSGEALARYRNERGPGRGKHDGKWPFKYDPDDIGCIYFQDPSTHEWHALRWTLASDVPVPVSAEAFQYAKELAVKRGISPEGPTPILDLLAEWDEAKIGSPAHRRAALRISLQRNARMEADPVAPTRELIDLVPSPDDEPDPGDPEEFTEGAIDRLTESEEDNANEDYYGDVFGVID